MAKLWIDTPGSSKSRRAMTSKPFFKKALGWLASFHEQTREAKTAAAASISSYAFGLAATDKLKRVVFGEVMSFNKSISGAWSRATIDITDAALIGPGASLRTAGYFGVANGNYARLRVSITDASAW